MKKFLIFMLCTASLFLIATPVAAVSNHAQTYELNILGDNTLAFSTKNEPTFWEKPTLKAGEYTTVSGTLTLHNRTTTEQKIGLRTVDLPYDNKEALQYLNHVFITVRNNNDVLYEGPYSRINDDRDFSLNSILAANAQAVYFIDIHCDYTYTGEGLAANDLIKWEFFAVEKTTEDSSNSTSFSNPALIEVLLACGIAAVLLGGVFLYDRFAKKYR